ncbi:MAG TPA: T9SS type A sorting domain-containing protein, partial [Candidatus Cloacimonadota bacterium]|nr:T9SS type A sorting domain-containing protein [Candidatus Cloacimonadota bacterium]
LMFYNDYTWGANAISPPAHPTNDGGQVMFAELQIVFPESGAVPTDPFGTPVVLSGSMAVMAGVMVDNQMASAGDVVAAFVNVGGTPQLRGKETVQVNSGVAGCLLQVFTENNGENIYFKLWDASTNQVLDVPETLISQVNGTVGSWPNDLFWLHAGSGSQQSISLQTGWNMVSLNVHPENMAISSIFSGIMGNLLMVKSPEGVYEPGNPYSTLTQMSDRKGYYVKVNQACTLVVEGAPIDVSIPMAMQMGWNLVAYTPQSAMPVATAVASIAANLIQVKGTEGIYEPGNPYSTLSTLSPGKAYWMKLNAAANLIYPAGGRDQVSYTARASQLDTPAIKTNSQSVLISFADEVQAGDILMAYVGEELRGIAAVMEVEGRKGALLQIFSDISGEQVDFRLRALAANTVTDLYPGLQTEPGSIVGDYNSGVFYSLSGVHASAPELVTGFGRVYPNPFQKGTNISLNVAKDSSEIKVEIYNLKGQKIKTLVNGALNAG